MSEIRKRLFGEPMMKLNLQQFAEGGEADTPAAESITISADAVNAAVGKANTAVSTAADGKTDDNASGTHEAEIARLKAEMAKQKAALDAATKEAGSLRKELRSKQTQEEIDAANKKEAEEKAAQELENLRKEVARAKSTKSVMSKLSVDEDTAGKIAECMSGCEDVDNALMLIQKAWEAKEKAIRLEFGKIPGPGAGGSGDEDSEEKAAIELGKRLGRERAESNKSVAEGLKGYIR